MGPKRANALVNHSRVQMSSQQRRFFYASVKRQALLSYQDLNLAEERFVVPLHWNRARGQPGLSGTVEIITGSSVGTITGCYEPQKCDPRQLPDVQTAGERTLGAARNSRNLRLNTLSMTLHRFRKFF